MRQWVIGFLLIVSSYCNKLHAEGDDVHFAAHFGASYAITTFTYGLLKSTTKMPRMEALIFASFCSFLVGLSYKYMEPAGLEGSQFGRAMLYNQAGIIGAGITIITFNF